MNFTDSVFLVGKRDPRVLYYVKEKDFVIINTPVVFIAEEL